LASPKANSTKGERLSQKGSITKSGGKGNSKSNPSKMGEDLKNILGCGWHRAR
jgi:hypothetical protein